ncbi:uncharacterized protein LOC132266345 [Cornus florida]|uniref:uncharacterized protein LOC132266345 n=1 Tax=Cornus florida TaxID=4283 RepID=UPI00289E6E1D|nr:uncharacterized protein LOC132266345 [Cornus florida]
MEAFLMSHSYDVWHAAVHGIKILSPKNPTEADKVVVANDGKAKHVLYCALKQQEFTRVKNCKTAKEIWDFLQATHEGSTIIKENKIQLFKVHYEACKMEERETVDEYLFRNNDIVNNMKSLSEDIKDFDVCKKILRSLTPRFNAKVKILEDKDLSQMKIDELQASLIAYEMRIGVLTFQRREATLKAKEVIEESEPKSEKDDLEEDEVAYLSKKFKKFRFKKKNQSQNLTCYGCVFKAHNINDKWYVDSGCSRHMTGDSSKFVSLKNFDRGNVIFRENQKAKIIGIGTVSKFKELPEIKEVILVEGLKHNLLSVSQLCDSRKNVCFDKGKCNAVDIELEKVLFSTCRSFRNVYTVFEEATHCNLTTLDEAILWHKRLGHLHSRNLTKILKLKAVKGLLDLKFSDNHLCKACQQRK